jgi:hypothetical protein
MKDQKFFKPEEAEPETPASSPETKSESIARAQLAVGAYEYETEEPVAKRLCMGSYN